ncbi:MAG: hypothetical protein ABSB32_18060 [Thermodesulfobacteriota bacterium]|jgi:hypothetical protein
MRLFLTIIILLALIAGFSLFALAQDLTIYDRNWRVKVRIQGDTIYDSSWRVKGHVEDGKIYDSNWRTRGRIESDQLKGGDRPSATGGKK